LIIMTIHAHENTTVEIQWHLKDGTKYIERRTVPPKSTREYKEEKEEKK